MITNKPWGKSTRRYIDRFLQVEEIEVEQGGYSSVHCHERKSNRFIVIEGRLRVSWFNAHNDSIYSRVSERGHEVIVMPGESHQFFAEQPTKGYELYFDPTGQLDPEDIVRFSTNGVYVSLEATHEATPQQYCSSCNTIIPQGYEVVIFLNGAMRPICQQCSHACSWKPQ